MKKKHAKTIRELAAELPNALTDGKGISPRRASAWRARFGWQRGARGFDVASCAKDVEQALADRAAGGQNADLKAELLESKIGILAIRQEQIEARLTGVEKVRNEARRIGGGYLRAVKAWQQITVVKHPALVRDVEALAKTLLSAIRGTMMT